MMDFLTTLAQRALGTVPVAEPMIAPRFAPPLEMPEPVTQNDAPAVPHAAQTPIVSGQPARSVHTEQPPAIDSARDVAAQSTAPRRGDEAKSEVVGDTPLLPPSEKIAGTVAEPALEHPQPTASRRASEPEANAVGDSASLVPSEETPSVPAQPSFRNTIQPLLPHVERSSTPVERPPTSPHKHPQRVRPQREAARGTDDESLLLPAKSDPIRTEQAPETEQRQHQPRTQTPAPDQERLLIEPLDKTAPVPPLVRNTAPTSQAIADEARQPMTNAQPLAKAQSLAGDALLVQPRSTPYDNPQNVRDQHQIEPHSVTELAANDTIAARRTEERRETEPATPPTIQVSIGRIEVRARAPSPPAPPAIPERPRPSLSLNDYLKRRNGGRP